MALPGKALATRLSWRGIGWTACTTIQGSTRRGGSTGKACRLPGMCSLQRCESCRCSDSPSASPRGSPMDAAATAGGGQRLAGQRRQVSTQPPAPCRSCTQTSTSTCCTRPSWWGAAGRWNLCRPLPVVSSTTHAARAPAHRRSPCCSLARSCPLWVQEDLISRHRQVTEEVYSGACEGRAPAPPMAQLAPAVSLDTFKHVAGLVGGAAGAAHSTAGQSQDLGAPSSC